MAPPITVGWSEPATIHLEAAWAFIARDNPAAADDLVKRILDASDALGRYPLMGRAGQVRGTRELVILSTPFILVYRIEQQREIAVLALFHGARQWPELF